MKLTQEELATVTEIRERYNVISYELGKISIDRIELDRKQNTLTIDLNKLRQDETNAAQVLTDKYGSGTIDIDSGEFISS